MASPQLVKSRLEFVKSTKTLHAVAKRRNESSMEAIREKKIEESTRAPHDTSVSARAVTTTKKKSN